MRRLIGVLVALAVILAGLAVADVWVRHRVQSALATHIQDQFPGSTAKVDISSFPFVGRLATSGTVPSLAVDVQGVRSGGFTFASIDLRVHDLKVDRSQLTSRKVVLQSLASGSVRAEVTQASIDQQTGVAITLGSGTAELGGVTVRPDVAVSGDAVTVTAAGLPPVRIPIPSLSILPCVGSAVIVPGALQLSCSLTSLPPALADFPGSF